MVGRLTTRGATALVRKVLGMGVPVVMCLVLSTASMGIAGLKEADLEARITDAAKGLKDITMVGRVLDTNKKALETMDANYAELYGIKLTNVSLKMPDKLRMEGRLGVVKIDVRD